MKRLRKDFAAKRVKGRENRSWLIRWKKQKTLKSFASLRFLLFFSNVASEDDENGRKIKGQNDEKQCFLLLLLLLLNKIDVILEGLRRIIVCLKT